MSAIVWTRAALRDLDAIQDFVAADNPRAAFRMTGAIFDRVEAMLRDHGRSERVGGTRELVLPDLSYIVVYRIERVIEILAVVHAARAWPDRFGD